MDINEVEEIKKRVESTPLLDGGRGHSGSHAKAELVAEKQSEVAAYWAKQEDKARQWAEASEARMHTLEALLSECHYREANLKRRTANMLFGPISALRESGWTAMAEELEQYRTTLLRTASVSMTERMKELEEAQALSVSGLNDTEQQCMSLELERTELRGEIARQKVLIDALREEAEEYRRLLHFLDENRTTPVVYAEGPKSESGS